MEAVFFSLEISSSRSGNILLIAKNGVANLRQIIRGVARAVAEKYKGSFCQDLCATRFYNVSLRLTALHNSGGGMCAITLCSNNQILQFAQPLIDTSFLFNIIFTFPNVFALKTFLSHDFICTKINHHTLSKFLRSFGCTRARSEFASNICEYWIYFSIFFLSRSKLTRIIITPLLCATLLLLHSNFAGSTELYASSRARIYVPNWRRVDDWSGDISIFAVEDEQSVA